MNKRMRMDPENIFRFNCAPGVACFTQCCQDVTIVLTPYDMARMKRGIGISSDEFLDRYTIIIPKKGHLIPLVILKMNEKDKRCPFVSQDGCSIYENRPWPCRMYPLDMNDDGTFRLITSPSRCLGLKEDHEWRIGEWLVDQGVVPYDEMNGLFSEITTPLRAQEPEIEKEKDIRDKKKEIAKEKEGLFDDTARKELEKDPLKFKKDLEDKAKELDKREDRLRDKQYDKNIYGNNLFYLK